MFGGLSGKHHVPFRHFVVAEEVVQCKGKAALEGCARRHACTERHVTIECCVEALDIYAEALHLLHDAIDITCPACARALRVVNLELYAVFKVDGVEHDGVCAVGADFGHDAFVYCTGEDETAVVVGVFANEINSAGRHVDVSGLTVEMLDEATSYFFNIHKLIGFGCVSGLKV